MFLAFQTKLYSEQKIDFLIDFFFFHFWLSVSQVYKNTRESMDFELHCQGNFVGIYMLFYKNSCTVLAIIWKAISSFFF